MVGAGFSPISAKLVSQITSGKFVELSDLLASDVRFVGVRPRAPIVV